jgi:hypothetical protein
MSLWAKAAASGSASIYLTQNFGSGGSGTVNGTPSTINLTTSWQRFTYSVAVPSISGKTIGTGSFLAFYVQLTANLAQTVDIWGVQVEESPVATAFQTATGTIQGELAACQRYYYHWTSGADKEGAIGFYQSSTALYLNVSFPVSMRITPTLVAASGTNFYYLLGAGGYDNFNSVAIFQGGTNNVNLRNTTEASGTAGYAGLFGGSASSSIAFTSEL